MLLSTFSQEYAQWNIYYYFNLKKLIHLKGGVWLCIFAVQYIAKISLISKSIHNRCGRVTADNIAYAKFRKTLLIRHLIKNPKRFWNVCNTNNVQGFRRFQTWGFRKRLQKHLDQKLKFCSKSEHIIGFENQNYIICNDPSASSI